MSRPSGPITPHDVLCILREHRNRWLVPTIVCGAVAVFYASVRPATWEASQAMIVRDEAIGALTRPGKFQQLDDMKTVQETILELAHSRSVLGPALAEVNAQSSAGSTAPSDLAIADLQGRVRLTPPKGAEFGKTEVFYLKVEAESPERAAALTAAISKHLQARSQEVRDQKAQGMIAELARTVELAKTDLGQTTQRLSEIERSVGPDLADLRALNETAGGEMPLRRSINELELELRQARQTVEANNELLSLLHASKDNPNSLVAAPNRLLEAQPVLRRLKDGLVDAQLRTAQLSGNMTDDHPLIIAAKISEDEVTESVDDEIDAAIRGVEAELRLSHERNNALQQQIALARERLTKLAAMRADYANVVAERNHRADIFRNAEQQLAEARASQAGANAASLIAALDVPVAGNYPVGPGKTALVLGGAAAGLILGLGIVFLTVQVPTQHAFSNNRPARNGQPAANVPIANGQFTAAQNGGFADADALKQAIAKVLNTRIQ